jgi:hypothetical protein
VGDIDVTVGHIYLPQAGRAYIACGRGTNVSIASVKLALNKALTANVHIAELQTWKGLMAMVRKKNV